MARAHSALKTKAAQWEESHKHNRKVWLAWFWVPLMIIALIVGAVVDLSSSTQLASLFFGGLFIAGAAGAAVRLILPDQNAIQSGAYLLGGLAGFLLGLSYMIPHFVDGGGASLFAIEDGTPRSLGLKFVFAMLVAFPGGLVFDYAFEKNVGPCQKTIRIATRPRSLLEGL